jgi:hypothetical protein
VALIGVLLFVAVARAGASERYAAAASLSLGFHYFFGWNHHHWGTHTLVLCIAALWSYIALLDFAARPGVRRAVLLGLALGLGLMAKFSFLLFLAGLVGAALTLAQLRPALCSRWMPIAVITALALCTPYVVWLAGVRADVLGTVQQHLIPTTESHFVRALTGLGLLLRALFMFSMPWLAIIAVLVPRAFDPRVKRDRAPTLGERLAFRTTGVAIALTAMGIIASGATNVAERYMHPVLVLAPVMVFGRLAGIEGTASRLVPISGVAVAATLVLLALRLSLPAIYDRPLNAMPYEALTREMAARGYASGTAIAADVREAGNLRSFLPSLRVLAHDDSHRAVRPPHREGSREQCFVIWQVPMPPPAPASTAALVPPFGAGVMQPVAAAVMIEVEARSAWRKRRLQWAIMNLVPQSPACR